jgi:hypothetical protein
VVWSNRNSNTIHEMTRINTNEGLHLVPFRVVSWIVFVFQQLLGEKEPDANPQSEVT